MKMSQFGARIVQIYGLILCGIGVYFIFFRPSMLPEDIRYISADISQILHLGFFVGLIKYFSSWVDLYWRQEF